MSSKRRNPTMMSIHDHIECMRKRDARRQYRRSVLSRISRLQQTKSSLHKRIYGEVKYDEHGEVIYGS